MKCTDPAGYAPGECHTGHAEASSYHGTAYTGTPTATYAGAAGLLLTFALVAFALARLFGRP